MWRWTASVVMILFVLAVVFTRILLKIREHTADPEDNGADSVDDRGDGQ